MSKMFGSKEFGEKFRQLRASNEITQRQVAEALGYHFTMISAIEAGRVGPFQAKHMPKLAELLGVSEKELIDAAGYCSHCKGTGKAQEATKK